MADALEQKPFGEFTLDIYSQIIDKIDLANQPKLLMPISTITGAANLMAINSGIESESVRFGQLVSRHCIIAPADRITTSKQLYSTQKFGGVLVSLKFTDFFLKAELSRIL